MIMNLLARNVHNQELCHQILNSHELPPETLDPNNVANIETQMETLNFVDVKESSVKKDSFKFKMQNIDHIERGVHCTKGKKLALKIYNSFKYKIVELSVGHRNNLEVYQQYIVIKN